MPEQNIEHKKRWAVHICLRTDPEVAIRVLELATEGESNYPLHEIKIPTLIVYGDKRNCICFNSVNIYEHIK
ncbi:unnamed protein product [marine sediment metagenome]|uniref:Uncharacterized protein n=1 Tax=marine sediment metagenome TaxID=412755 RepID=X1BKS5_9ZZZZ